MKPAARWESELLYMVVERFKRGAAPVYERAAEEGRLLPAGLDRVDSWVDERLDRCFQLMEAEDRGLLDEWTARWSDLVDFEVVPVITSTDAAARVLGGAGDP
jgi:Protein of unknown function (DUF3303)